MRDIPDTEKLWVGGHVNGHCGRNNSGKEETIGKYGVGESNEAGDNCVAFAMSHNMRVVNTYFEKVERHKITYKSGAAESQIDAFGAEAVTRVPSKTAKLSWVKV